MEKIFDLLHIFFEKYLIPTLVSIIFALASVALVPSDHWIIARLGDIAFGILVYCSVFVFVIFIIYLKQTISDRINADREIQTKQDLSLQNNLKRIWSAVDRLRPEEREYLLQFIKNNNQTISFPEHEYDDSLWNSAMVYRTRSQSGYVDKVTYRLTDETYELLKYSYDTYGKISHFDIKEND